MKRSIGKTKKFKTPKEFYYYEQQLLNDGNYKQFMYENTRKVKRLYLNSNKFLDVVPQTNVWQIICAMQKKIDELEKKVDFAYKDLDFNRTETKSTPIQKTLIRKTLSEYKDF